MGVAIFGDAGKWWMGIIVILASIGTLNAVVAGVPRILYGMALTRQLPSPFAWLIPATRAPWVGILIIAAIPAGMNLAGRPRAPASSSSSSPACSDGPPPT